MNRPLSVLGSNIFSRFSLLGVFAGLALSATAFAQNPYGGTATPNGQNSNQYPVSRSSNPSYPNGNNGPYNAPYSAPNAIPEGTRFIAVLDDKLETKKLEQGKKFKLKLAEDLTTPSGLVIPRGKKIKGHVSSVDRGFHGRILLSFDEIETKHGWVPLVATVTGVPGEHGVNQTIGNEGEISRRGTDKRRAIESAGVGAAVGAVAGGVTAGTKGAIIGAAAGAGLGAGAGILTDRDLTLNKGTQLELQLDRQLTVPQ